MLINFIGKKYFETIYENGQIKKHPKREDEGSSEKKKNSISQLNKTLTNKQMIKNSQINLTKNEFFSDRRVFEENAKNKKNILPEDDLNEILDRFLQIKTITNEKSYFESISFIMNEIIAKNPSISGILKKLLGCMKKLTDKLLEKKSIEKEMDIKVKKLLDYENEIESLKKQNFRYCSIFESMKKRGFDFEKLFQTKWDILVNPNENTINVSLAKIHLEESKIFNFQMNFLLFFLFALIKKHM